MRIVIAGAGDVGFHLAKLLALESHQITLIDIDKQKLNYASKHLDVETIKGSSTSLKVLKQANIHRAELLIAATSREEINFTTAVIGKRLGAKRTVARVSNLEFLLSRDELFMKEIGIDEVISPELLAANEIKRLIRQHSVTDNFEFERGKLSLLGIKVGENSLLENKTLEEIEWLKGNREFTNVALLRDYNTVITKKDTRYRLNDFAYFIAKPEGVSQVQSLVTDQDYEIKKIMILGGTKVGYHAARLLSKKYKVKLIEPDLKRCESLADSLPDTLIINGDERNMELLREEHLEEMDAVVAVADHSETNIIASLAANNVGVKKIIAMVENMDYIHLAQSIGVDTIINTKLISADFIFRYIRKGDILAMTSVHGADCEVLEFEVHDGGKLINKSIGQLKFPEGAIIGGVIRNDIGIIPKSDFKFELKDHVVVLSKPNCIHKVETFF